MPPGEFVVQYKGSKNIPCGDYKVCVIPLVGSADPTKRDARDAAGAAELPAVPRKYQSAESTPLTATVKPGDNHLKLEVAGE
ncbi:hypothetical protein SH661x_004056 [Planctomicrobium sp. SH661]|uniref:hypothetical protein n=1 Tax=Planctomicrobium sp. SH661 TaxID=3448124 RepID=UPI003F5C11B4